MGGVCGSCMKSASPPPPLRTRSEEPSSSASLPPAPSTPGNSRRVHLRERLIHEHHGENPLASFDIVKQLGVGLSGSVYLVKSKTTGTLFALKTMRKESIQSNQLASFQQEVSLLRELDHPNIVKLNEYFETDDAPGGGRQLCLCVRRAEGKRSYCPKRKSTPRPPPPPQPHTHTPHWQAHGVPWRWRAV